MATPKSQRIGIWIIAVVLTVGTVGSFVAMVLANDNQQKEYADLQEQYKKLQEEEQRRVNELSDKYYPEFKQYKDTPAAFDAGSVGDKVVTKDLKVGDGAEIAKGATYQAYYIGWNPKGKVFDSSFSGEKLKEPLDTKTLSGLIQGWEEGVIGMKVGGVREVTIPSDLAYGEQDKGDDIPPNTPLKFIIMIVSKD